jgi:HEAT repeat protein
MPSVFDRIIEFIEGLGPAGFVVQAIVATAVGIGLLIAFILGRRAWRHGVFQRRDQRSQEIRKHWEAIVSGEAPLQDWNVEEMDRRIVETLLLDQLEAAQGEEARRLLQCLRLSGLLDRRILEARTRQGWRKRQALFSLGRTRAPEVIPALAEALDDPSEETRVAAIRGLGRLGIPDAAVPILDHLVDGRLKLPNIVIQNALLNCCRWQASILVPYMRRADAETRALVARVLGEIATGDMDEDLLLLAGDTQAEVRASAARSLGETRIDLALSALGALAEDQEWFVRLRAVVALGNLRVERAIPMLVDALCDSNRFVRLRAASGLAKMRENLETILDMVREKRDPYAMQALISELQRDGVVLEQVSALLGPGKKTAERILLSLVKSGALRLLVSTLLLHTNWRVRVAVARLLARSGAEELAPLLEHAFLKERSPRQRKITGWLLRKLKEGGASSERELVPVR